MVLTFCNTTTFIDCKIMNTNVGPLDTSSLLKSQGSNLIYQAIEYKCIIDIYYEEKETRESSGCIELDTYVMLGRNLFKEY